MRVLITGGVGFIGQHLARRLGGDGHETTALDLLSAQVHSDPGVARDRFPGEVITRDVCDPASWAK